MHKKQKETYIRLIEKKMLPKILSLVENMHYKPNSVEISSENGLSFNVVLRTTFFYPYHVVFSTDPKFKGNLRSSLSSLFLNKGFELEKEDDYFTASNYYGDSFIGLVIKRLSGDGKGIAAIGVSFNINFSINEDIERKNANTKIVDILKDLLKTSKNESSDQSLIIEESLPDNFEEDEFFWFLDNEMSSEIIDNFTKLSNKEVVLLNEINNINLAVQNSVTVPNSVCGIKAIKMKEGNSFDHIDRHNISKEELSDALLHLTAKVIKHDKDDDLKSSFRTWKFLGISKSGKLIEIVTSFSSDKKPEEYYKEDSALITAYDILSISYGGDEAHSHKIQKIKSKENILFWNSNKGYLFTIGRGNEECAASKMNIKEYDKKTVYDVARLFGLNV